MEQMPGLRDSHMFSPRFWDYWSCYKKNPHIGYQKPQKFTVSCFWSLKTKTELSARLAPSEGHRGEDLPRSSPCHIEVFSLTHLIVLHLSNICIQMVSSPVGLGSILMASCRPHALFKQPVSKHSHWFWDSGPHCINLGVGTQSSLPQLYRKASHYFWK